MNPHRIDGRTPATERTTLVRVPIVVSLAIGMLVSACAAEVPTPPMEVATYDIGAFLDTTNYRGASFSPDNSSLLVSTDQTGIFNAFTLAVDGSGGDQLTSSSTDSVFALGYFPDDERILYGADQGGNELRHLYVRDPDGAVTDLTPGEEHIGNFAGWAGDNESFYVSSNERDRRFFDVYEYDVNTYDRELIFENEGFFPAGSSNDGRMIALAKMNTNADSDALVYDRDTGELRNLSAHEGDISNSPADFTPDDRGLLVLTDDGAEFAYLVRYDLETGAREEMLRADWDISFAAYSRGGTYLVVGINNDARTELRLYEAATMALVELPDLGDAEISSVSISRDEQHMAFYSSSSRAPRDLFYYRLGADAPVQLTRSLNPNIDPDHLVDGSVKWFESWDGLEVPGILYKPHQASPDNKVPALLWVHGGPGGQSRIGYSGLIQYVVNHGYAVYAINNRGSSGYGKTFFHLDDQRHGHDDLDDCVASKRMLIDTTWVDPDRIGILGGSYGGYMTLAALTFRPEEFTVGVDLFGISNWVRTLESIPPWWEAQRAMLENEMGPFDDLDTFRAKSPLFHADQIVRPLMVLQGANDPRVVKAESDDIVEAVRENGVPVEYVVFDDEGHGFVKKENQEEGYRKILEFLETHLRGAAAPASDRATG